MMKPGHVIIVVVLAGCAASSTPAEPEPAKDGGVAPGPEAADAGGADGAAAPVPVQWVRVPAPTRGASLFSVWGSSASDVWAVGSGGTILHFDGQAWARVPTTTSETFHSVWGSGAGDVWVAASTHLVLHGSGWDGGASGFTNVPPDATASVATLYGLGGSGPNDLWAVGDWTIIEGRTFGAFHWAGASWARVPVVNDFSRPGAVDRVALRSVWAAGASDVWLGGSSGRTFRNAVWSPQVPIPFTPVPHMAALPPWKEYDSASRADVERTWGTASNDVWMAGSHGVVRHWDGSSEFLWRTVDLGTSVDLHGVWGQSGSVWVVGEEGTIVRFDGATWSREKSDPVSRLYGVWGHGKDTWIVGEDVILRHVTGEKAP